MTKNEAKAKLEQLLDEAQIKVREAERLADQHGLRFTFEPDHIGDYYGKGDTYYYGSEDPLEEGRWVPSSWSSSSLGC